MTTEVEHLRAKLDTAIAVGTATDKELVNHALVLMKMKRNIGRAIFLIERRHVATAIRLLRDTMEVKP